MKLTPLFVFFFLGSTHGAADSSIQAIQKADVFEWIVGRFRTREMRVAARRPGHPVHQMLKKVAQAPLFITPMTKDEATIDNHPAYYRVLTIRDYKDPLLGDLYLLHELYHISDLTYDPETSFENWKQKMITNEKAATYFTESIIYFYMPEVRALMPIQTIWVDRYLSDEIRLEPTQSNWKYFQSNPVKFSEQLKAEFLALGKKPLSEMEEQERRTWAYDRWNELYGNVYWSIAPNVEKHMQEFYRRVDENPETAAAWHLQWLEANNSNGVLFPKPSSEFNTLSRIYDRLPKLHFEHCFDDQCAKSVEQLNDLVKNGRLNPGKGIDQAADLLNLGVSGTVYSITYPETKTITEKNWQTTPFNELFGDAYTRKQDSEHLELIDAYRSWSAPVLKGLETFEHAYPSNGSSEAIKDTLALMIRNHPKATLHVFEGEYEGIAAYAEALQIPLKSYPRNPEGIAKLEEESRPGDYFYLSQPSGIDGNLWEGYDEFMKLTQRKQMNVLVDLAYVGTVARPYQINVSYPNISSVFFSLSKGFGVYYQRIGGVFSKEPNPLLFGNKWFKNLMSIRIGTELLKSYDVYHIPRKYQWAQFAAVEELNRKLTTNFKSSDVVMLAHQKMPADKVPDRLRSIFRGGRIPIGNNPGTIRPCLTPSMTFLIDAADKNSCSEVLRNFTHPK